MGLILTILLYAFIISFLLGLWLTLILTGIIKVKPAPAKSSVTVLVLGDIGRSPRMQYHALCLSKHFEHVDLIGSAGTTPKEAILAQKNIRVIPMKPFPGLPAEIPRTLRKILFLFYAPLKISAQIIQLFWTLLFVAQKPTHMLLQNPPSLPTLIVMWIASRLRGAQFVVDWHNLGYTILALSLGDRHPLVKIARWVERIFGAKLADSHLTVTEAMKKFLIDEWGVDPERHPINVLRDQPHGGTFQPFEPKEREDFFSGFVDREVEELKTDALHNLSEDQHKILAAAKAEAGVGAGDISGKSVAVVVSSTSWTPDEDFSVLLDALKAYDDDPKSKKSLLVVITGKGPQRELYLNKFFEMKMKKVLVLSVWLPAEFYPKVLACADVGVSLHQSSSKLDLPMKVLDMFGAGLPVFARWYQWYIILSFLHI